MLLEFREFHEDDGSTPIHIDPAEVVTIRHWKYHTFRPAITEVVLRNGREFHLNHDPEYVTKGIYGCLEAMGMELERD